MLYLSVDFVWSGYRLRHLFSHQYAEPLTKTMNLGLECGHGHSDLPGRLFIGRRLDRAGKKGFEDLKDIITLPGNIFLAHTTERGFQNRQGPLTIKKSCCHVGDRGLFTIGRKFHCVEADMPHGPASLPGPTPVCFVAKKPAKRTQQE